MTIQSLQTIFTLDKNTFTAFLVADDSVELTKNLAPADVAAFDEKLWEAGNLTRHYTRSEQYLFVGLGKGAEVTVEKVRKALHSAFNEANSFKAETVQVVLYIPADNADLEYYALALGEMPVLSNYEFNNYKSEVKNPKTVKNVRVLTNIPNADSLLQIGKETAEFTCIARDWVNEPPNVLTPVTLAERAQALSQANGVRAEIWDKKKIEEKQMGGLLAVNRGSQTEPRFIILEYIPDNATNDKPIVLVGKGITFDTGGLSLKPTPGSMDSMKSDMAGAAAVICAINAVAKAKLSRHVIALIPSTDNRPGEDAYTPNDVIKMMSGNTVEVLNTDAEGRMILADALHYAKELNPALVIDLATLTGAAVIAVGTIASALMTNTDDKTKAQLIQAGLRTYERLVELPLWDEYDELIKSDIADMKNIGGRYAGSITAGKFLQRFTGYPWAHIDIAGPAFLESADSYRGKNGTGVGVRLLFDFIRNYNV